MYRVFTRVLILNLIMITMLFSMEKLDDVIITSKSNKEVIDVSSSVSIITQEDIKKMHADSLVDILNEVVGLNLTVNNSSIYGRKNISIRGLESRNSLILIDGKRVSATDAQIGHSDFQYNWIPLESIEKIEIIRGPMSSLYGSNALGGVINIITKQPSETIVSTIDIEGGTLNENNQGNEKKFSFTSLGKVTNNFSYSIFAEDKNKNITENENSVLHEGKEIKNLIVNTWFNIDDSQEINLSAILSNEVRETIDYPTFYNIKKRNYAISYNKYFEKFAIKLKYYETKSNSNTNQFKYSHILEDKIANAEISIDAIKNNRIILGGEFRKESYNKSYDKSYKKSANFNDSINYNSLFIQDEIDITNSLILTLGARYDKHENFGSEISPKAYIVYKIDEYSRLKGGYGHGFSAPTVTQTSPSYIFRNYYAGHGFNGNKDLKPESLDSYEISYEFENRSDFFKTTLFYNKIKNLIDTKLIGTEINLLCNNFPIFIPCPFNKMKIQKYDNISEATTKGLELEYKKINLLKDLNFDINYTYLKTKDKQTNNELKLKPEHTINTRIVYSLPYDLQTTFRYKYIGNQKDHNNKSLKAYSTFALQLSKKFTDSLSVKTGIENLTNKKLNDLYDYQLRGRFYYVGLNYTF